MYIRMFDSVLLMEYLREESYVGEKKGLLRTRMLTFVE